MSKRDVELFLFDIYIAIVKIEQTVGQFSNSQELLHNYTSWDSVIREFEIIGEATNQLLKAELLSEESRVVVDFRNLLIHHYFGIDPDEVWNVVVDELGSYKELIVNKITALDSMLKSDILQSLFVEFSYLPFVIKRLKELE